MRIGLKINHTILRQMGNDILLMGINRHRLYRFFLKK